MNHCIIIKFESNCFVQLVLSKEQFYLFNYVQINVILRNWSNPIQYTECMLNESIVLQFYIKTSHDFD